MLTPIPMQHVTLFLVQDDAPAGAMALAECGTFDPRSDALPGDPLPERSGERFRNLFRSAQLRLEKILTHIPLASRAATQATPHAVTEEELATLDEWLGQLWRECSECEEIERRLNEEARQVEQLTGALENYTALDINLGLLQGKMRFLDVQIGTFPASNIGRLTQAVQLIGYSVTVFMQSDDTAHVALAGLSGVEAELRSVLDAASFRHLELPPEFRDHPAKVREELAARSARIEDGRGALRARIENARQRYGAQVGEATETLIRAAPYAQVAEVLHRRGALTQVSGWVPSDRIVELHAALQTRLRGRFVLETRDPSFEERPVVPSALRHPAWIRPFAALVRDYGIPRYGEFDPTWMFAITFVAMFGMMFGDVGHGALIALGGVWLRRRLKSFTIFAVAVGVSSMLFGLVYGSVFGFESIIHPLWMSPLQDPMLMLTLALYWGIGFILLATAITIRNRLAERRYAEALLDGKGLAGAALYLGLLFAAFTVATGGRLGVTGKIAVLVPLATILAYRWHESHTPIGERILVVFIEGFETFMSYVANTLSFCRVAAFSLNHVALAIGVFTLAAMLQTTGHWITVVLGNVFILVLEGAIVAIQVLRLEYYEGFSRFFSGDGREFRPLTMGEENVVGARTGGR